MGTEISAGIFVSEKRVHTRMMKLNVTNPCLTVAGRGLRGRFLFSLNLVCVTSVGVCQECPLHQPEWGRNKGGGFRVEIYYVTCSSSERNERLACFPSSCFDRNEEEEKL